MTPGHFVLFNDDLFGFLWLELMAFSVYSRATEPYLRWMCLPQPRKSPKKISAIFGDRLVLIWPHRELKPEALLSRTRGKVFNILERGAWWCTFQNTLGLRYQPQTCWFPTCGLKICFFIGLYTHHYPNAQFAAVALYGLAPYSVIRARLWAHTEPVIGTLVLLKQ